MIAMRIFFCCAVLAVSGCVLDGSEESGDPVDRLEEAALQYEDVMSSLRLSADGQYTSDLGPVDVIVDGDADTDVREPERATPTAEMNICWWDQGYRHCCGGSWCCVWIDGYRYCG